ncbi:MAG: aspartyl/asparaginyl beta-hydroxylase domain-containing protein [Bacteroidota bacterium]
MAPKIITPHLKLPIQFEEKRLLSELKQILTSKWIPHFNSSIYEGAWTSLSLYARGGDEHNIFAQENNAASLKETPILANCPYIKEVIQRFECPLLSVRLLRLGAGGIINPHRDDRLGYEDGCFRLHIPILTNPEVEFLLNGDRLDMASGECWYTNVNYTHSVANRGTTDRIHLVIDCERNIWSDQIFFSLAPEESFQPTYNQHKDEEWERIIAELQNMDVPSAPALIDQLRKQRFAGESPKS